MTSTCISRWAWSSCETRLAAALLSCAAAAACAGGARPVPRVEDPGVDLILVGGVVHTMDPLRPRAEAVAVHGGRVQAVGTSAEVRALAGTHTRVIELAGRAVTPGLTDGHCHLYGLGVLLATLDVRGAASAREVAERVRAAAAGRPPGEWIVGRGWDQNLWTPPEFPTRAVLDAAAPRHPVVLRRIDGHALWANGAALAAAGIGPHTADPQGGRIVRDAAGAPTGILVDAAIDLVERHVPPPSRAEIERRILSAADAAVAAGLTGVHEMGIEAPVLEVYRDLAAARRLKLRVVGYVDRGLMAGLAPEEDRDGTARFVVRGVKLYADGALGSRGAALLAPYADDPDNTGLAQMSESELGAVLTDAARAGWQVAVHAIGDRGNRMVLDSFEAVGPRAAELRFRVEHAQVLAPADVGRFARLGVAASMQPTHATSDMPWAGARLGPERLAGAYAWRSVLVTGAHLVGGSDFPIEDVSPLAGLYAAVTRQDRDGRPAGGWYPDQRLTLDEALRMFTVEPAWAAFVEGRRGRVAPGYVADLTVLDRDLDPAGPGLLSTRVDLTLVGGEIVFERH